MLFGPDWLTASFIPASVLAVELAGIANRLRQKNEHYGNNSRAIRARKDRVNAIYMKRPIT